MFYSETLLSKTGPLARVWLSANMERKLSKSHILQSNIESSVSAIVDQGQAPLALRLSGQLLLGVVRIYSRKARYLLDDCNEAILKIKMAFRPGNVDLPANQSHAANPSSLVLPDVLTELDLLAPIPDPSLLLSQSADDFLLNKANPSLLDWGSSQRLSSTMIETGRDAPAEEPSGLEDDIGLTLDIGEDFDETVARTERDVEAGRDAPPQRSVRDELDDTMKLYDDDLELELGDADHHNRRESSVSFGLRGDDDTNMRGLDEDSTFRMDDDALHAQDHQPTALHHPDAGIFEPGEESSHQHQRVKRRKVLQADAETEIPSSQIRAQQRDRSKISKATSFLPRDPMLLALMEMQKSGGFVSNILGDGRGTGLAPELRGVMSLEVIRGSGDLKRKRGSDALGIPRIEYDADDMVPLPGGDAHFDTTVGGGEDVFNIPADEDVRPGFGEEDEQLLAEEEADALAAAHAQNFDDTTMPVLHPNDQGPVSLGTKHAVHLLRDRFGGAAAAGSPAKRAQSSVLFQDLLPEKATTKANATKMFFEVLVLATKDAVKVEQEPGELGGPLRVRAKRGLWGSWAETEAGGEIATQEEEGAVA